MQEIIYAIELGLVACAVAIAAKYIRIPYTIALVLAGLLLGFSQVIEIHLSKELILLLFLPPLLFEGAIHMDLAYLRRYARPVGILALLGTLVSAAGIGAVIHYLLGLDWQTALLLGIILSPTDPVSVLAMFKQYGVPKGLQMVLEGESVFNDGIGIVLYLIALETFHGEALSVSGALLEFIKVALGGAVVGGAVGYLAYRILQRLDDHLIEVMISLVLAFGSYMLAEQFHFSGVVSVVVAGLIIGNYGTVFSMSPTTRLSLINFWAVAAFIVNSAVFLLIGLDFDVSRLPANFWPIVVVIVGVLFSRALTAYGLGWLSNRFEPSSRQLPLSWLHVLNWGGLRGSIPIALALGLEPALREVNGIHLPTVVFGVALFSLVVQGLTMKPLLDRLGLTRVDAQRRHFEEHLGKSLAQQAAIEEVERMREYGEIRADLYKKTLEKLQAEQAQTHQHLERLSAEHPELGTAQESGLSRRVVLAQKAALADAVRRGVVSEEVAESLAEHFNAQLEDLE